MDKVIGTMGKYVVPALLLANVVAILFMPSFIMVDGPMNTLRASVVEAAWTTPRYHAEGITYDDSALTIRVGMLLRIVLLHAVGTDRAETCFAVLVSLCLLLATLAYVRSIKAPVGPAMLWLAPLGFSFILVVGFLDFMLGVALVLAVAAGWQLLHAHRAWRWVLLPGVMLLAWYTHRGAPVLLVIVLLVSLLFEGRGPSLVVFKDRAWLFRRFGPMLVLLITAGWILYKAIMDISIYSKPMQVNYEKWFLMRPFLLFHLGREGLVVGLLGVLLTMTLAACIWVRGRLGAQWHSTDRIPLLSLVFTLIPMIIDSEKARLLYVPERCQWVALLFFVLWIIAIGGVAQGLPLHMITTMAWAAMPLQAIRLQEANSVYSGLEKAQSLTREAMHGLEPGSLAMPVLAETNWLLRHLGAMVAVHHNGVLLTHEEHLRYRLDTDDPEIRRSATHLLEAPHAWLPNHWETGEKPIVDHLIFIGTDDSIRSHWQSYWKEMLEKNYTPTFDNGYVTIHTAWNVEGYSSRIPDRTACEVR